MIGVLPSRRGGLHKFQINLCTPCLGQWDRCAYPMSFYCMHCELFWAKAGFWESDWYIVDINGKKSRCEDAPFDSLK